MASKPGTPKRALADRSNVAEQSTVMAGLPAASRPKCPKGVPPSKLLSCSKFRPAGPDQALTCGLCGRTQKGA
jgi:hypothetical protein